MVTAKSLTKVFFEKTRRQIIVVNNLNFIANDGEIFGLLGPNGAGKTTTLRIIATILKPTAGTVIVDGNSVIEVPGKVRRNIGFMTGETKLYDRLTVRETFKYFGKLYNVDDIRLEKRIEELILMFGLNEVRDRRIANLSDGMRQKVSLGRTIIHNPKNLILDEPLTGLDILARRTVTNFIKEAKKRNNCIIFSTHVMSEAEELCDRIAIINKGLILDIGAKEELKARHRATTLEDIFIHLLRMHDEESDSYI